MCVQGRHSCSECCPFSLKGKVWFQVYRAQFVGEGCVNGAVAVERGGLMRLKEKRKMLGDMSSKLRCWRTSG